MAFLGLVPSERSTGDTRLQGGITKAGMYALVTRCLRPHGPIGTRPVWVLATSAGSWNCRR